MTDNKNVKKRKKYFCDNCDYITSNKTDYNRHLSTDKHLILTNTDECVLKTAKTYNCDCGNLYKHRQSLLTHKKKCKLTIIDNLQEINNSQEIIKISDKEDVSFKQMFLEMVNQNKELQKTIMEQSKTIQEQNKTMQEQNKMMKEMVPKIGNNNTNKIINNNIINNLTLLNNNCKDALSLNEFIDSIQVDVKDLMYTSEKGLTDGVANIFLENYNKLPLQKRPLWCGDKKRKKLYVKDEEWEEDTNNIKTKSAIKSLTAKQAKNSNKYIKENPDWMNSDSKKERFIKIVGQTTQEIDDTKQLNIINNLLDNVHLTDNVKTELQVP